MRGRKPKPVEQKIAEGNPGHRPLPSTILIAGRPVPAELEDPPDDLGLFGREWWAETVPAMAESGFLDRIDYSNLKLAAAAWDDWQRMRLVISSEGYFTTGSVGQIRPHPAIKMAADAEARFRVYSEAFGWNPMARTRLGLAKLDGAAKFAELNRILNGNGGDDQGGAPGDLIEGGGVGLPGA